MKLETLKQKMSDAGLTYTESESDCGCVTTLTVAPDYDWDNEVSFHSAGNYVTVTCYRKSLSGVAEAIRWGRMLQHVDGETKPSKTTKTRGCAARVARAGR